MKMNRIFIAIAVLVIFCSLALALPPAMTGMRASKPGKSMVTDTETMINVNNLQMFVTNAGGYAMDWGLLLESQKNDGLYYPAGTDKSVLFSAGIWVGGLVDGEIRLAVGAFDTPEYYPGPADATGNRLTDRNRFKVYKILKDNSIWLDPNKGGIGIADGTPFLRVDSARHFNDYQLWKDSASIDGAPLDSNGNPLLFGDQSLWAVFNDGGPHNYAAYGGGTLRLGVELQANFFGFDLPGALGNTIFARWVIINKSPNTIDSTYISLWADPDLGGASDDLVGCDTALSLGYCYNGSNNDQTYGSRPPAIGFDFFQGPIIRRGDPIYPDSVFDGAFVVTNTGDTIYDAIKLGMESFNKYTNGTDPDVSTQAYGFMRGFDAVENCDTCPYVDPDSGFVTKFFGAGDPISGKGWIDASPGDRRFMLSAGPFTMSPNDTQVIAAGIVVGQGADRLTSVSALKFFDQLGQYAYDVNFQLPSPPPRPVVTSQAYDRKVVLTWTDRSELEYKEPSHTFEGYVVYQGQTVAGPWRMIATYDVNNGFGVLRDDVLDETVGAVVNKPVVFGSDAGVRHYIEIDQDYILGTRLHNGMDYYYAVTAYSYAFTDPTVPGGLKFLENRQQTITVTPQDDLPGSKWATASTDEQATYSRINDQIPPTTDFVTVTIVDPTKVTDHQYRVLFRPIYPDTLYAIDSTVSPPESTIAEIIWPDTTTLWQNGDTVNIHQYWELWDLTTDTRLLAKQWNKSGDDNYNVVDGILVKIIGQHVPKLQSVTYFNNNAAHRQALTGINAGLNFFFNGADYGINFWGGYLDPAAMPDSFTTVEVRFMGSKANGQYAYNYLRPGYSYQDYFRVPFQVWDVVNNRQLNAAFVEWSGSTVYDSTWGPNASAAELGGREYLFVLKSPYSGDEPLNSAINYTTEDFGDGSAFDFMYALWPALLSATDVIDSGDVLEFLWANPSDNNDRFTFQTTAAVQNNEALAKNALDDIRVVPNPYYAFSIYEANQFDRQVRFLGMPDNFTLRIFNIAGDKVRTLSSRDKAPGQSWLVWNLQTDEGSPVAGGVYIWYLDAPGIGAKYGKMAVFPEIEQLNTY
ncbi:MAG: hypothetical protein NT002_07310 [candidate division Zixibacteria bacterium]|nr:hypothetical protein [candidate division Zixibacteria bacterium]